MQPLQNFEIKSNVAMQPF